MIKFRYSLTAFPSRPLRFKRRTRLYTMDHDVKLSIREGCGGRKGAWEWPPSSTTWPHRLQRKLPLCNGFQASQKPVRMP